MSLETIILLKVIGSFMLGLLAGVYIGKTSTKNIKETK